MSLFAELKRRNVIRMAGLYLVGAWLIVQIAETLLPIFDTPGWVLKTLVVLLALGFIPALIFSWVYELTPEGLRPDAEASDQRSLAPAAARRMDRLLLLGMLVVVAMIVGDRLWPAAGDDASATAVVDTALTGESPSSTDAAVADSREPPSIAVLPFANLSSDPEQEYFSDGMTEELLNVLARIPGLRVAARTSVFEFKDKGGDVREIGRKLGVSHIVEGSVRRDGDRVRVTAQLIRVSDGFQAWSERYDRKLESVFALQDELAGRVGAALKTSLGVVDPSIAAVPRTAINPEAYDHYLKGRALLRSRTDLPAAIAHFTAAVEREPGFAAGWSSLSLAYEVTYWYLPDMTLTSRNEVLAKSAAAAARAAAIDPDAAAVIHAVGSVARTQFRYADAERHYLRAMQIDPSYPDVREDYAEMLYMVGRTKDSWQIATQLVKLDPLFRVGWNRVYEGAVMLDRRKEVELATRQLRELAPNNSNGKFALLDYAIAWDRTDEARAELAVVAERWPEDAVFAQQLLPWALGELELDRASLREVLATTTIGHSSYYLIAAMDLPAYDAEMELGGPIAQTFYFATLNTSMPKGHYLMREPLAKASLMRYGFPAYWREKGWPPACRPLGDSDFECGIDVAEVQ